MLAYAAGRPRIGERRSSPNTMLLIICAHVAAVAAIMSAKLDVPRHILDGPTIIRFIHDPTPPPPNVTKPRPIQQATHPTVYTPPTRVPTQNPDQQTADATLTLPNAGEAGQVLLPPQPPLGFNSMAVPVSTPAQPLTAASDLKPPYPEAKLLAGEEAELRLRLTVDEHGRVVAIDPIGRADPVFLAAARRHLLARWRYKPAMQDGRAVASTVVVTLRFQLDDRPATD